MKKVRAAETFGTQTMGIKCGLFRSSMDAACTAVSEGLNGEDMTCTLEVLSLFPSRGIYPRGTWALYLCFSEGYQRYPLWFFGL
jgi:hypothetical protein